MKKKKIVCIVAPKTTLLGTARTPQKIMDM